MTIRSWQFCSLEDAAENWETDDDEQTDDECGYDPRYDGWVCPDGRFIPSRTHPWSLTKETAG